LTLAGLKIGGDSEYLIWNIKLYAAYLTQGNEHNYAVRFSTANNMTMQIKPLDESKLSVGASLGVEIPLGDRFSLFANGGTNFDIKSNTIIGYNVNAGLNLKVGSKKENPPEETKTVQETSDEVGITGDEKVSLTNTVEDQMRAEEARLGILHPDANTTQEQIDDNRMQLIEELKKRVIEARARRNKPLIKTFNMSLAKFETGSFTPTEESQEFIKQLAGWIKEYEYTLVTIEGHTDSVGNLQSNILLSSMRAKAVRDELVKNGVDGDKIYYIGYGPTMPIASNATYNGKIKNRRVEVFVE
jgi:outer membrane protein OmpA-like peptidoglycan-associated protein